MRYEMRLAGTGGQGVILAGIILAEAGILEGHYVTHTQNYGPEARGGTSISDVIFSDAEIEYPKTLWLDMLLALDQKACDNNLPNMKPEGLVIVDSDLVDKVLWEKVIRVPIFQKTREEFKDTKVANMLALGALATFCPWVSPRTLEQAIQSRLPARIAQPNLLALRQGTELTCSLGDSVKCKKFDGIIEV